MARGASLPRAGPSACTCMCTCVQGPEKLPRPRLLISNGESLGAVQGGPGNAQHTFGQKKGALRRMIFTAGLSSVSSKLRKRSDMSDGSLFGRPQGACVSPLWGLLAETRGLDSPSLPQFPCP